MGHGATGVEPRRRPAAGRRRVPRVGGRRRGDRRARRGARLPDRLQRRWPQRRPDRLDRAHRAAQDRADDGDPDRRRSTPRTGRGRRPVAAPRGRGRGARPRVPRRDVTECRRARLRARGRPQLADPDARARVQQHRGGRGRHGGRPPDPRRPRHRARAVLGDPRRWWQRRRGDIDRARAVSDPGDLCRWPVLADRARDRGPQRVADVDRDRARGLRIPRADAAAARRPVPPRAPARPRVRPGRARVHRQRRRRRRASSGRCGTSIPSSTRSGSCRRRTSAS